MTATWTGTDAELEAALRAIGNLSDAPKMKVLQSRVDGLVVAYRCALDPLFVAALKKRTDVAHRHGRAGFTWRTRAPEGVRATGLRDVSRLLGLRARWANEAPEGAELVDGQGVWGMLRYSDRDSVWTVQNTGCFIMQIFGRPPGAVEHVNEVTGERTTEPGWSLEIKFYASFLADVGLDAALREGEAMASLCGAVFAQRLRRIDLCADVQGWGIYEDDVNRLVKRPRARWQKEYGEIGVGKEGMPEGLPARSSGRPPRPTKVERDEETRAQDYGRGALERRQITGVSVGRGGALMSRIYDKRAELERDEPRRVVEEARWSAAGWDGTTRVTRVEFQLRGSVLDELGIRDPACAKDVEWGLSRKTGRPCIVSQKDAIDTDGCVLGLVDRLDWVWRTCLEWVKIVRPERTRTGKLKAPGLLEDDERWTLLRSVQFAATRAPHPIKRWRVRAAASSAMSLGCALSQAARDGAITRPMPEEMDDCRIALGFVRWGSEIRRMTGRRKLAKEDDAAILERFLSRRVRSLMVATGDNIVRDMIDKRGGVLEAVEHFAVRHNAAFYQHLQRRLSLAALASGPPDGGGSRAAAAARRRADDDFRSGEGGRAVA